MREDVRTIERKVRRLRTEVDCRIGHGAEGHAHLCYVRAELDDILLAALSTQEQGDASFCVGCEEPAPGRFIFDTEAGPVCALCSHEVAVDRLEQSHRKGCAMLDRDEVDPTCDCRTQEQGEEEGVTALDLVNHARAYFETGVEPDSETYKAACAELGRASRLLATDPPRDEPSCTCRQPWIVSPSLDCPVHGWTPRDEPDGEQCILCGGPSVVEEVRKCRGCGETWTTPELRIRNEGVRPDSEGREPECFVGPEAVEFFRDGGIVGDFVLGAARTEEQPHPVYIGRTPPTEDRMAGKRMTIDPRKHYDPDHPFASADTPSTPPSPEGESER